MYSIKNEKGDYLEVKQYLGSDVGRVRVVVFNKTKGLLEDYFMEELVVVPDTEKTKTKAKKKKLAK